MAISDVQLKNHYYQVIDDNGRRIKEIHENNVGELQGIGIDFIVFLKNHYYATYDEGTEEVTLHALFNGGDKIIPAGNVVLLKNSNSESSISYRYVSTGTPVTIPSGNCFVHHDNAADASHTDYVLKNEGGVVAFYRFDAACSALDGYNVLRLPIENTHIGGGSAPSMIRIVTEGDNATALVPVYEDQTQTKQINDGCIYTILGVPVSDMSRPGIYIQNGKKYVVR